MRSKPGSAEAPPPERRLAAILAADIDGYSRLLMHDDDDSHRRVAQEMDRLRGAIRQASGAILSFAGDCLMARFGSPVDALRCALRFQAESGRRMAGAEEPIRFRMAINAGEIRLGNRHAGGAAINLAARLEKVAPPGGVVLPGALHDQIRHAVPVPVAPWCQPRPGGTPEPLVVVAIAAETCLTWIGEQRPARKPSPVRPAADTRAGLAIVPFRADTAGEAARSLALAVTDGVIRWLGGMATWMVVTRAPAVTVRAPTDLQRLRQISDARYVLHGAVESERTMTRLTVELNEAETGRVLWSDRFTRPTRDLAALAEEAPARIACAIPPPLVQRELDRSSLLDAGSLTAHDLALRAQTMILQPDRATFGSAAGMLRHAELLAPPRASARYALVCWHLMAITQGWSPDPAADARAAAEAAAGLDPADPASMALSAHLQSVLHRDHATACTLLDRVIDEAPFCGLAWSLRALTLAQMGEGQDAMVHACKAAEMPALGPDQAWRHHVTALACYVAARYAEAARWARVSAMHYPGLAANARVLAASLAVLGRLDEAQQAAERVLEIDPEFHIGAWRRRSWFTGDCREQYAQRLRLAGLPE
jgi:class 3 adenylate cyclase/TolB-like protein